MHMTAAVDGEPEGLVDLYVEQYAAMVRLAYLMVGQQVIAEELVQDAFTPEAVASAYGRGDLTDNVRMLKQTGATKDVLDLRPVTAKFEAFGWFAQEIDGHAHDAWLWNGRRVTLVDGTTVSMLRAASSSSFG